MALVIMKRWNLHFDYMYANVISYILSILWSFYWNSKFVFEDDNESKINKLLKTYVSYCFTGIILNSVFSYFLIEYLEISKMLAPFIVLILTVPANYFLNKYWTFQSRILKRGNTIGK